MTSFVDISKFETNYEIRYWILDPVSAYTNPVLKNPKFFKQLL